MKTLLIGEILEKGRADTVYTSLNRSLYSTPVPDLHPNPKAALLEDMLRQEEEGDEVE